MVTRDEVLRGERRGIPEKPMTTEVDAETDALMEKVFPPGPCPSLDLSSGRIFAVIPEEIVGADLEEFSTFVEQLFQAGDEIDSVVESLADHRVENPDGGRRRMEVVIPDRLLGEAAGGTAAFLDRVFEAFEEIDEILEALHTLGVDFPSVHLGSPPDDDSGDEEDPGLLLKAIDRVGSTQEKLKLMIRQTRHELRRLKPFRLARKSPGRLLSDIRKSGELPTLQYLVEFLHAIHLAAESFEKIGIPRPHIRDYLEFLYRMEDWKEMESLVGRLRMAVRRYAEKERGITG